MAASPVAAALWQLLLWLHHPQELLCDWCSRDGSMAAPPVATVPVAAAPPLFAVPMAASSVAAASMEAGNSRGFPSRGCCTLSNGNNVTCLPQ